MNILLQKIRYDLWQNKRRTLLAILSISAGVFAIGAFFGMVSQLLSTMDASHKAVNPSHILLNLNRPVAQNVIDGLVNVEGVAGIEALNQISVRYKLHPDDNWASAILIMRKDYAHQAYNQLQLKEGHWPDNKNINIERISSNYYDIQLGDSVIFELNGVDRAFPVTGLIRHPFVLPPEFGGSAYFFVDETGLERFGIPRGYFTQLYIQVEPYSLDYAKEVGSEVKARLADENINITYTLYQDPDKHWGRSLVEGASYVLQLLAVISLLTSAVLIFNTLSALIAQQTDQIGILKSIGGQRGQIMRLYLLEVFIYGLLALLIALPTGVYVAFLGSRFMLNIFNIDYALVRISKSAVTWQVLTGLGMPIIAALWPVWRGANISVRQAIASYGLGGDFGSNQLDKLVETIGLRYLSTINATALGNMFRRKGRLLLTQLVLVVAGVMFLLVMTLNASINLTLDNDFARRDYETTLTFTERHRLEQTLAVIERESGVIKAQGWLVQGASILRAGQRLKEAGVGSELVAMPLDNPFYKPLILEGRWILPEDEAAVVVGKDLAEEHGFAVGDEIILDLGALGDDTWQIVGIFQSAYNDGFQVTPMYTSLSAMVEHSKQYNKTNRVVVQMTPDTDSAALDTLLRSEFRARNMDLDLFSSATTLDNRLYVQNQFDILISFFLLLALIMALVGGISLMGALSINVVERTREIGVLRSIGAKSGQLMGMFVLEGVLQGLFSWLIAVPISYVVARPVAYMLGNIVLNYDLDYRYNTGAMLAWLTIVLLISIFASIIPANSAARISVRESLAYG